MVGFIKGFFGTKSKPESLEEITQQSVEVSGESGQTSKAFFLNPDEAKTFGNIEYMRSTKTIRRTFPKTRGNGEEFDLVQQVSALEAVKAEVKEASTTPVVDATPKPAASVKNQEPSPSAAVTDTNLDMFRRMARDIKKR
ncbi:MAG TPA: hypothetical protein V6C78_19460 [Crinalium sp.]|jgi:hypothetical protein